MSFPMQVVLSMAGFFVFGVVSVYMLYQSEREAKRWLILNKVWSPNKQIADEPAELSRLRLRLVIFYALILAGSLWWFQRGLTELWNRSVVEEQAAVTEETSPGGRSEEATAPAPPGDNEQASLTDQARAQPSRPSRPRPQTRIDPDKAAMVSVPGGTFWMGISDDETDRAIEECKTEFKKEAASCRGLVLSAQPRHRVTLDPFTLDPYEVTNRQFEKFVQATGYQTTAEKEGTAHVRIDGQGWQETKGVTWRYSEAGPEVFASDRADHPVVNVSWHDAEAYCWWAGKRLPTEAEFEYATRAGTQTVYWWGNFSPGTRQVANVADESGKNRLAGLIAGYDDGAVTTAPVGSYEANPFGLFDMAGNVTEWVADRYDGLYYRKSPERNPTGPSSGNYRMIRGGSWNDTLFALLPTVRDGGAPTKRDTRIGFRCAQDRSK
jgi:sulfatase modifying factor 1